MIGKIIVQKRKAIGLTQAQLANRLGVTAPAVNRWEKDLCFPDATLLPPLARCLKTDLNELFSFYEALSAKERKLILCKTMELFTSASDTEALAYIEETIRQNLSDGQLYYDMANLLLGMHTLRRDTHPEIYLDHVITYYERALELLPDMQEDISYTLVSIYAELGDAEKANAAWARLSARNPDKALAHVEMLHALKNNTAALPELQTITLQKIVDLSTLLDFLRDVLTDSGNLQLAELAQEKAAALRQLFDLWDGFDIMSCVRSERNPAAQLAHLSDLVSLDPRGKQISSCPLFADATLGNADRNERTTADRMADLLTALKKLER